MKIVPGLACLPAAACLLVAFPVRDLTLAGSPPQWLPVASGPAPYYWPTLLVSQCISGCFWLLAREEGTARARWDGIVLLHDICVGGRA